MRSLITTIKVLVSWSCTFCFGDDSGVDGGEDGFEDGENVLRGTDTPEFGNEINQLGLQLAGLPFPVER